MLVFIIAIYKRHELTKIVLDHYRELQKKYGFVIVIAGSEGNKSKQLAKGFDYIEVENSPLTFKNNAMMLRAKKHDPDAVVLMGSDDIINENVVEYYYKLIEQKEQRVCGFSDLYFYDYMSGIASHYESAKAFGAGRFFPRNVLNKIRFKGWGQEKDKGCDGENQDVLNNHGVGEIHNISLSDINGILIDIKGGLSISDRNITLVGKQVNPNTMARVSKKVSANVNKLAETETKKAEKALEKANDLIPEKTYTFISNGKNREMPHGKEYKVSGDVASILVKKGLGHVED